MEEHLLAGGNVTILSLLDRYFDKKCSDDLHSIVPTVLTFTAMTRHTTPIIRNHLHSLRIRFVRGNSFFSPNFYFVEPILNRMLPR